MKESILSSTVLKEIINNSIIDKPFRLNQILNYVFKQKIYDFNSMYNLPKKLIAFLNENYSILNISLLKKKKSKDGTTKFLFQLSDDFCIESVILKDKNSRYTFCISSQSGCRMNCTFCTTGKMGLLKNLHYTEIISQILFLSENINKSHNIVFMGMGEPLDNYENLVSCLVSIKNNKFMNYSLSRITVSTCGITDKIIPLISQFPKINLAVSLNSLIQKKRIQIMPITKKYPLNNLIETLYQCYNKFNNRITLEFILFENFNMGDDELKEFSKLKKNIFLINVIPDNALNSSVIKEKSINSFCAKLQNMGFNVTKRYRRGEDIKADCGQLYWEYKKK